MYDAKRYQRCLENAQDAFTDAMRAQSLGEQLSCLKRAETCLLEASLDTDFPHWFAWRKSDGTMCYKFPGPSPLLQVFNALTFVRNCFNNCVLHLHEANPRTLVGEMFGKSDAIEGPMLAP